jgi:threonine dehydrogenase-like Zn-dependent dehydrogenase
MSIGTELRCYRGIPVDPPEAGGEGKYLHEWVPFEFPYENGYSTVGRVVQVGSEAAGKFTVGDRVALGTAHAEYSASAADGVWKIPGEVSDETAVWLFILGVGELALRRANPKFGATIGIVGLGMVGLSSLAYCMAYGFKTVCIDPDPARRAMAKKLGGDLVLSPFDGDFEERVAQFCGGAEGQTSRPGGAGFTTVGLAGPDVVLEGASRW